MSSPEATRIVDNAIRDAFDHWLTASPNQANKLLDWAIERGEERLRRKKEKEVDRASATRKLRLPASLPTRSQSARAGRRDLHRRGRLAGGSAKQARNRINQAVPAARQVLNVAGASRDKLAQNQQIADLVQALGCGTRDRYREDDLRYDKIILMTDADVDGAHIASLLMTFFFQEMPKLIDDGHLYLALPPALPHHAGRQDALRDGRRAQGGAGQKEFKGNQKIEITRFKGLGEMPYAHLRETTMDPRTRSLLRVKVIDDREETKSAVDRLMGSKPEARFEFIQENASFVTELDV